MANNKKHYTETEKKLFLRILVKYSHIIERKKSDATTLKDKEEAWNQICNSYNVSVIASKRSVQQLKKLWSNLKSTQRDALTQEKQARLLTGGGPEHTPATIDPDIVAIAPNLMTTAPTLFSSNLSDEILQERQQRLLNDDCIPEELLIENVDNDSFGYDNFREVINDNSNAPDKKESSSEIDDTEKENNPILKAKHAIISSNYKVFAPKNKIQKRRLETEENIDEKSLKVKRMKCIIDHEQEIANLKIQHQEAIQKLEIDHLKEKYALEIRAATAATELSELLLKEKNK